MGDNRPLDKFITPEDESQKAGFDLENVFMLYATFCGDVERTAHAASLKPSVVMDLAQQHGWNERLRGIIELKNSGRPGDVERAINRALNFVQAHRYRGFLERVIQRVCSMDAGEMDDLLISLQYVEEGKSIKKLSTRPLADLAAALEKCHAMTYSALNDSATERKARDERPDSEVSGGELHAVIARAMTNGGIGKQLSDAQDNSKSPPTQ